MNIDEAEIVKFVEPILRFCLKRLDSKHDAEDLASEIIEHILDGIRKYRIDSLEGWVWRIAHNRYAKFIAGRKKRLDIPMEYDFRQIRDDNDFVDKIIVAEEHEAIFKCLHTLSSVYRHILVDRYLYEMSINQIAKKRGLTEATVKWRLNAGREKIRIRIGEYEMNKIYTRIKWDTETCNGSFDPHRYLHGQSARAICEAAYDKPLTIDEISLKTGLPAMYVEDELPRLIHGDAITNESGKYATNFIILRECDKKRLNAQLAPLVADTAAYFDRLFHSRESEVRGLRFYGSNFTMRRLGYVALPSVLRRKIKVLKESMGMMDGPYPPRMDGGYGWFIIEETEDESAVLRSDSTGCNSAFNNTDGSSIHYYWIGKYFNSDVYRKHGTLWLCDNSIIQKSENGKIPQNPIVDEDCARLLKNNLIFRDEKDFKLNFAVFESGQYNAFTGLFDQPSEKLDGLLTQLIQNVHDSFTGFTPKRLKDQINQWVSCYSFTLIGMVAEELISCGTLEKPITEKPMTNGVFYLENERAF